MTAAACFRFSFCSPWLPSRWLRRLSTRPRLPPRRRRSGLDVRRRDDLPTPGPDDPHLRRDRGSHWARRRSHPVGRRHRHGARHVPGVGQAGRGRAAKLTAPAEPGGPGRARAGPAGDHRRRGPSIDAAEEGADQVHRGLKACRPSSTGPTAGGSPRPGQDRQGARRADSPRPLPRAPGPTWVARRPRARHGLRARALLLLARAVRLRRHGVPRRNQVRRLRGRPPGGDRPRVALRRPRRPLQRPGARLPAAQRAHVHPDRHKRAESRVDALSLDQFGAAPRPTGRSGDAGRPVLHVRLRRSPYRLSPLVRPTVARLTIRLGQARAVSGTVGGGLAHLPVPRRPGSWRLVGRHGEVQRHAAPAVVRLGIPVLQKR